MTNAQMVRALRRFGRELLEEHDHHSWEVSAFGAPSEIWDLINRSNFNRVTAILNQLGVSMDDLQEEFNRQIHLEATQGTEEPPEAFYEILAITEGV